MKKTTLTLLFAVLVLASCGEKSQKKRNLDDTLFAYAALIRWSNYDGAMRYLKPNVAEIQPTSFELEHIKQFKVSKYLESPISPGAKVGVINQSVEIQLYNIHSNQVKTIYDHQSWEFDEEIQQWFLLTGLPKLD